MADWKQITARIRRARTGKDPAGQLTNLFSKTRAAMVAFELARYFEANGNTADAGRWYLTAAERFRRSDWKTKAQENATRLGATEPAEIPPPLPRAERPADQTTESAAGEIASEAQAQPAVELEEAREGAGEGEAEVEPTATPVVRTSAAQHGHRRVRGKRDHRGQRRGGHHEPTHERERASHQVSRRTERTAEAETSETEVKRGREEATPSLRGKYGDPGLSSRLTQLEMNFRRLLACPAAKLEDAGKAPAGPGVWVLTDSDLTTYYYVEACQTLRVAIPNILKGSVGKRGESIAIKPALADNLGIPEARVAKYLSDHCVVRWLQMDEDAAHFAHFLIAVLRPALNE